MPFHTEHSFRLRGRVVIGVIVFLFVLLLGVTASHAVEIVPSVGLTKATNGDADAQIYGGLAFRGNLAPMIKSEVGVSYRSESRFNDQLKVRMWPVTASLYLTPLPMLYAGGGVGWYQTTFNYASTLPLSNETRQELGVHLGGGLEVPLAPRAGLDVGARYVMMRPQGSRLVPEKFDPDFWTTSIGLAIKF